MTTRTAILLTIALGAALFSFGCTRHQMATTMDSEKPAMAGEETGMKMMKDTSTHDKMMDDTMKDDQMMDTMDENTMKDDMKKPMADTTM